VTEKEHKVICECLMSRGSPSQWWVYVLLCADRSLYTGVTTDVSRRPDEHNAGTASKYTRARRPVRVAYREPARGRSAALKREAAIKSLSRKNKQALVAAGLRNPSR
jgi:putative endonuclease